MSGRSIRLGVNIDHVATVRNARAGVHPSPVRAALIAATAGADGITAHLREDRRHITDDDITALMAHNHLPLNLEMAATPEMLGIALRHAPHACCIVPEKRAERTTEGGLNLQTQQAELLPYVRQLQEAGIRVSLFVEPDIVQIDVALALGAPVIELHTGQYAHHRTPAHLQRIVQATQYAHERGMEVHAGHGLNYASAAAVAGIPHIAELNIGHFLIGEAVFVGLAEAVRRMRTVIDSACA
jgi:pyridoxine 5-phosphate synthase